MMIVYTCTYMYYTCIHTCVMSNFLFDVNSIIKILPER